MNEAILHSLVRLATGGNIPKLCPDCGSPTVSAELEVVYIRSDDTCYIDATCQGVGFNNKPCDRALASMDVVDLVNALNQTV